MCLWDAESLREMELTSSDVGRAVSGFVPKHSAYFYQEKIAYTLPMLRDGSPERWDDVAVAHEKIDEHADALRVIEEKDRRFPGLYTTHANRGTFLARNSRWDEGIADLERALEIDPHAHFGRERVQIGLYRYLQRASFDGGLLAREDFLGTSLHDPPRGGAIEEDTARAILGMMIFGAGERSTHLWLGLGLILARESAGTSLAMKALRRAEVLGHPHARDVAQRLGKIDAAGDDEDFAEGQAEVAALAAEEDARIRDGERAALFGY